MASGGDEPVSDDPAMGHDPNHSVFANALLNGLSQMQPDEFTGRELFDQYVFGPVGGQSRQVPEYNLIRDSGHNSGDFVFYRSHARWEIFKSLRSSPPAAFPVISAAKLSPSLLIPGLSYLTMQGSGFTSATQIKINSLQLIDFKIVSDTEINANIGTRTWSPSGADVEVCSPAGCSKPYHLSWTGSSPVAVSIPAQPPTAPNTISLLPYFGRLGNDLWLTGTLSPGKRVTSDTLEIGQRKDGVPLRALLTFDLSKIPKGSRIAHAELNCKIGGSVIGPANGQLYHNVLLEGFPDSIGKNAFDSEAAHIHTIPFGDIEKPQDVTDPVAAALSAEPLFITFRFRFDQEDSLQRQLFSLNAHLTTLQITLK
jgi:hypothetical protein